MTLKCNADARQWLDQDGKVPENNRDTLAELAEKLIPLLPDHHPWLLCLGGAPGTGKSTLANLLAYAVEQAGTGTRGNQQVQVLSLDDYYLPLHDRQRLAKSVDARLAQRGVPGTHDLTLLTKHLDTLLTGSAHELSLPVFDKGADDRSSGTRACTLNEKPVCVILEGWFLGVTPVKTSEPSALAVDEGPYERWINRHLAELDSALLKRSASFWQLDAPDWETVRHWRWQQECDRPETQRMLHSLNQVDTFLEVFRPLVERQLHEDNSRSDLRISLDTEHSPHLQCAP